jgi:hypothetical protein
MLIVATHRQNYSNISSNAALWLPIPITPGKTSFYDLVDKDMQGNEVKMESFKGDVLCVVNVASK